MTYKEKFDRTFHYPLTRKIVAYVTERLATHDEFTKKDIAVQFFIDKMQARLKDCNNHTKGPNEKAHNWRLSMFEMLATIYFLKMLDENGFQYIKGYIRKNQYPHQAK